MRGSGRNAASDLSCDDDDAGIRGSARDISSNVFAGNLAKCRQRNRLRNAAHWLCHHVENDVAAFAVCEDERLLHPVLRPVERNDVNGPAEAWGGGQMHL